MSVVGRTSPEVHDVELRRGAFADDVLYGLGLPRKRIAAKYFYDAQGSELFEHICELPEYYLTRTELAIMNRHAPEMAAAVGRQAMLIELGSGSGLKTRVLLHHVIELASYVPVDISRTQLAESASALAESFPELDVVPVWADYTTRFRLPRTPRSAQRRVVYFPGSTIGNFTQREACTFLKRLGRLVGPDGGMLVGVDLKKDPQVLHAAYNDLQEVTAAFNLNVLGRINRELAGDFCLERFGHYAFYNPRRGAIEMHLVSLCEQKVHVAGELFHFDEGESIFTECSHKYTLDGFEALAIKSGWSVDRVWIDDDRRFSVQYLTPA